MRRWRNICSGLIVLIFGTVACGQDCWTNTAGHPFTAELIALTDTHATFVMASGETNLLTLGALCPASQKLARTMHKMPEIPNKLLSTVKICQKDLRRIDDLHADGRLDEKQYTEAKEAILSGFKTMYRKHGLPEEEYPALEARLLSTVDSTPPIQNAP